MNKNKKYFLNIFLIASVIFVTMLATWYVSKQSKPPVLEITKNQNIQSYDVPMKAPDFDFTDWQGQSYSLSDFIGKTVVLNFWESWCAPCVVEFPQLIDLARRYPDRLVVLALSSDDTKQEMMQFLKAQDQDPNWSSQPNIVIALDEGKRVTRQLYSTYKLPESYIIAPDQSITRKIIGLIDWSDFTLE